MKLNSHSEKCALSAAVALASVVAFSANAAMSVYTLAPGASISAEDSAFPTGGTVLNSVSTPFAAGTLVGTLNSAVIQGDTSNPYGGLTFTYQLILSPASPDSISQLTISSFANLSTDASFNPADPEPGPLYFTRSGGAGNVVRAVYLNQDIMPGQTGALLVIQTDASTWAASQAGISDGLTVNVDSLAPFAVVAVPEPRVGGFLLAGLCVLALVLRGRH